MSTKPKINLAMAVVDVPMADIFHDELFNTRRSVVPGDVLDLSKNISVQGLLQPIMVQPWNKMPGFKFRIVLGHRRHKAVSLLDWATIPAIIREGLSDIDALKINFNENINRKDLNILEEAYGVKRFLDEKLTIQQIANIVNVGKAWVIVRKNLLTYPSEIQEDAACGYLTQSQLQDLADVSTDDEKLKIVKAIKEAKFRGDKRLPDVTKKVPKPHVAKQRGVQETYNMIEHILEETKISSPFTRAACVAEW